MGEIFTPLWIPSENYRDMADHTALDFIKWSPVLRQRLNEKYTFAHPENPEINRLVAPALDRRTHRIQTLMRATPYSMARRRLTARPAAPALRLAWRNCMRRGG